MQASEVMSKDVISITPQSPIGEAVRMMLNHRISGLPVVDDGGRLVGIVTEGDFLRRAETGNVRKRPRWLEFLLGPGRLADEYIHTHGRKVEEVMTREVVTVGEDASLDDVVTLMEKHGIKRVPVLRDRKVVGIVSRANLMRALLLLMRTPTSMPRSDRAIRDQIRKAVETEPWGPKGSINVVVRNGAVELYGSIFEEREREALHVLIGNIPGVKGIRDELLCIEPISGMVVSAPGET